MGPYAITVAKDQRRKEKKGISGDRKAINSAK
jgi:hypothetical protein